MPSRPHKALAEFEELGTAQGARMTRHVQLLTALVVSELASPLLAEAELWARIFSILLFGLVCVAVFRALFATKRRRWIGSILAGLVLAMNLARLLTPGGMLPWADVLENVSAAAFFVFVLSVIISHVFGARQLRIDDVVGAFSGYIIIALLWGRLYSLTWRISPGSFSINPDILWQLHDWNMRHSLFDFYSFTTISSIGYAGITTTGPAANQLVWLEVMCGQFYLAVVVATIVGIKVAQALSTPRGGQ
jgi:voltage-gated potassium channel